MNHTLEDLVTIASMFLSDVQNVDADQWIFDNLLVPDNIDPYAIEIRPMIKLRMIERLIQRYLGRDVTVMSGPGMNYETNFYIKNYLDNNFIYPKDHYHTETNDTGCIFITGVKLLSRGKRGSNVKLDDDGYATSVKTGQDSKSSLSRVVYASNYPNHFSGYYSRHLCGDKRCVNSHHVSFGDNTDVMILTQKILHNSRIAPQHINHIRQLYLDGEKQTHIARLMKSDFDIGIKPDYVGKVINMQKAWHSVDMILMKKAFDKKFSPRKRIRDIPNDFNYLDYALWSDVDYTPNHKSLRSLYELYLQDTSQLSYDDLEVIQTIPSVIKEIWYNQFENSPF